MKRETLMYQSQHFVANDQTGTNPSAWTRVETTRLRRRLAIKVLGTATLFAGLSFSSVLHAGTDCDAYVPSCGDGICDCGSCDAGSICDMSSDMGSGGCDCGNCGSKSLMKDNPLFKSLDFVAGGIEKVLGLDRCGTAGCGHSTCDSGCGCASSEMESYHFAPEAPMAIPTPMHAEPLIPAPAPVMSSPRVTHPRLPSVPPIAVEQETIQPRMTEPRIVEPAVVPDPVFRDPEPQIQQAPAPSPLPQQTLPQVPAPMPEPEAPEETSRMPLPTLEEENAMPLGDDLFNTDDVPVPAPKAREPEGSIFDALDDPFSDEEVRLRRPYGSVRPTSLKRYNSSRRSGQPSTGRQTRSSQRPTPNSNTIGSGLRPVSHEESVQLKPLGSRRVLAPYRASR